MIRKTANGAADRLPFAAAPAFALMAILIAVHWRGPTAILCTAARENFPFGGMAPMYLLMSAVHSGPWLRLMAKRFG